MSSDSCLPCTTAGISSRVCARPGSTSRSAAAAYMILDFGEEDIDDAIAWTKQAKDKVGDFAAEQVPLLCQELLVRGRWQAIIIIAWGVAFCLVAVLVMKIGYGLLKKGAPLLRDWSTDGEGVITLLAGVLLLAVGAVAACTQCVAIRRGVYDYITVTTAPRAYIIEQLRHLIR